MKFKLSTNLSTIVINMYSIQIVYITKTDCPLSVRKLSKHEIVINTKQTEYQNHNVWCLHSTSTAAVWLHVFIFMHNRNSLDIISRPPHCCCCSRATFPHGWPREIQRWKQPVSLSMGIWCLFYQLRMIKLFGSLKFWENEYLVLKK